MRPRTVAEACGRVQAGQPWEKALAEFLDTFYRARSPAERAAMLAEEPARFDDPRYDALVGAIAEYLFKRYAPDRPPSWIGQRSRYLRQPWFPTAGTDAALQEYCTFASPPEFKSRNIMTDATPLRRATTPRLGQFSS